MATDKKVLIIDDDAAFRNLVEQVLTQKEYQVLKASSGREGLRLMFDQRPDLVLLDVVIPGIDGWQVCTRIREISDVPIIMITGRHKSEEDIVRGLDYGADDYLTKPVRSKELVARVQAVLRRAELPYLQDIRQGIIYSDDFLTVDITERKVTVDGKRVKLTPREFRLFTLLVENAGRILTHKQLLEKVWGWEYTDDVDYVRIYISHLRQKIEPDPAWPSTS
jgi:two-component system KDP operon response regulator KdpE